METTSETARRRVRELGEEYRDKGYEVIVEPASDQLPDFLAGYRPDQLSLKILTSEIWRDYFMPSRVGASSW
jgi:Holliday junction resolvase